MDDKLNRLGQWMKLTNTKRSQLARKLHYKSANTITHNFKKGV